jgi:GTPase SAR1 family protein
MFRFLYYGSDTFSTSSDGAAGGGGAITPESIEPPVSTQIIRFDGSTVHCTLPEFPGEESYEVITVIGQVRQGKSTLMNCLISNLMNTNCAPFATSDALETCTRGIQMVVCKSVAGKNYIILDCHGLADTTSMTDARNDPALLLLAYAVSGTMVHNVTALNNATVKELEALTVFLNEVHTPSNPRNLLYRVRDHRLKCDIQDALKAMFVRGGDHYDHIKNTIENNFVNRTAVATRLTDADFDNLDKRDYMALLANPANGIKKAVEEIMSQSCVPVDYPTFCHTLSTLAEEVNQGRIDLKILDVIQTHHENIVMTYINKMRLEYAPLWSDLEVSDKQPEHDKLVKRQHDMESLLAKYTADFAKLDPEIMKKHRAQIAAEFKLVVKRAFDGMKSKVDTTMVDILDRVNDYAVDESKTITMLESDTAVSEYIADVKAKYCEETAGLIDVHLKAHTVEFEAEMTNLQESLSVHNDAKMDELITELEQIELEFRKAEHIIQYINKTADDDTAVVNVYDMFQDFEECVTKPYNQLYRETIADKITEFTTAHPFQRIKEFSGYNQRVVFDTYIPKITGYESVRVDWPHVVEYYWASKLPRITEFLNESILTKQDFETVSRVNQVDFVVLESPEFSVCTKYLIENVFNNKKHLTRAYVMHLLETVFGDKYSPAKIWKVLFTTTTQPNVFKLMTNTQEASFLAELLVRFVVESKICK